MRRSIALVAVGVLFIIGYGDVFGWQQRANATITVLSHWRMGEEAGDTDGRLDSVGGRHFSSTSGPSEFTTGVSPAGNGSEAGLPGRWPSSRS